VRFVLLSTSSSYSPLILTSPHARSIDIDWEYPGQQGIGDNVVSLQDSANFLLFLQTLRSVAGVDARLSMAANVAGIVGADGNYLRDLSGFAAALDYLTVRSLPFHRREEGN
jgi:GH18 family chitinase